MIICEKCYAENTDDADACGQCGAHLNKDDETLVASEISTEKPPCPECGGKVKDIDDKQGICTQCGTKLVKKDDEVVADDRPSQRLSQMIKDKINSGLTLDNAIDAGCEEFLAGPNLQPNGAAASAEKEACPVCGKDNPKEAEACAGCKILFKKPHEAVICPKCSARCSEGKCSCGAILTLPELLKYLDSSVLYVCPRCRQLYSSDTTTCADCGAEVLWADRLKKYAAECVS